MLLFKADLVADYVQQLYRMWGEQVRGEREGPPQHTHTHTSGVVVVAVCGFLESCGYGRFERILNACWRSFDSHDAALVARAAASL